MKPSLRKDGKPVLDEATFQKLLEAAYVVQEHSDRASEATPTETQVQPTASDSDSTTTLAEIVETQHEIHAGHHDLDSSASLVAERIRRITGAQGAAIGVLEEDKLVYRAGSGILASQVGTALRREATLSASTLLHDAILRCADAATDFRVNPEIARRLGIGSLISVPVFHDGKTAGALELVFAVPNAFQEHDVRTCQLMAGLVTEALTHAAEEEWRKGVTAERASMLEVLERIKPQLARLAQEPKHLPTVDTTPGDLEEVATGDSKCPHCGHELAPGEVFCGSCGTSRSTAARNDLQSKWATLWNLKKAGIEPPATTPVDPETASTAVTPESQSSALEDFALPDFILPEKKNPLVPAAELPTVFLPVVPEIPETAPASLPETNQAASAPPEIPAKTESPPERTPTQLEKPAEPRVWLRSIAVSPPAVQLKGFWLKSKIFVRKHPGDLALAAAAVLFAITIVWAISANNPTTSADSGTPQSTASGTAPAKPKRKAPPPPKLGLFDQLLVSLGLAEAPPPPSYTGNPNVPVWVDVHTALYYCPGSELYGKTPQGKIASQRDAQMDQFEPASRKVCD
jgi:hypothetical protein